MVTRANGDRVVRHVPRGRFSGVWLDGSIFDFIALNRDHPQDRALRRILKRQPHDAASVTIEQWVPQGHHT